MPRKSVDVFSGDLFPDPEEPKNQNQPELLYHDAEGRLVDAKGNTYDETGKHSGELPSKELQEALKKRPDLKPNDAFIQLIVKQMRIKEEQEKNKQKRKP